MFQMSPVIAIPGGSLLLLNTYFPCDPRNNNFDDTELVGLLGDIENAITDVLVAVDLTVILPGLPDSPRLLSNSIQSKVRN